MFIVYSESENIYIVSAVDKSQAKRKFTQSFRKEKIEEIYEVPDVRLIHKSKK